jgi:deoxyadenosine/deoxycytidine kinase
MACPLILTVDGSIGAGKSTILDYIHKKFKIAVEVEPIEKWQPFLNDLYGNRESSAFNLQVRVWLDRCLLQKNIESPIVMERSPMFQENVFVRINKEIGRISECQAELIKEMYSRSGEMWQPAGYVYLRTDPVKCIERIAKRNRKSEDAIPIDYMMSLHDLHEQAYAEAMKQGKPIICIEVEGKNAEEVGEEVWSALKVLSNNQLL